MGGRVGSIMVETEGSHILGSVTEDMKGYTGTPWEQRDELVCETVEISWRKLQDGDGGMWSLRFPSLEAYREDKDTADTLERVKPLQLGSIQDECETGGWNVGGVVVSLTDRLSMPYTNDDTGGRAESLSFYSIR